MRCKNSFGRREDQRTTNDEEKEGDGNKKRILTHSFLTIHNNG